MADPNANAADPIQCAESANGKQVDGDTSLLKEGVMTDDSIGIRSEKIDGGSDGTSSNLDNDGDTLSLKQTKTVNSNEHNSTEQESHSEDNSHIGQDSGQQIEEQSQSDNNVLITSASTESISKESSTDVSAPASISLKRSLNRGSAELKEKRRKWETKTESPDEDRDPDLVPGSLATQNSGSDSHVDTENEPQLEEGRTSAKKAKRSSGEDHRQSAQKEQDSNLKASYDTQSKSKAKPKPAPAPEPESDPTNILLVQNLVRPFTLTQLKEVLSEKGSIDDEKFWIDKVKSKCCVVYESIEVAKQAKESLHGRQWPTSNPKTLKVFFVPEEILKKLQQSDSKPEPTVDTIENGSTEQSKVTDRLGEKLDDQALHEPVKKRLGDKVSGEVSTKSSNTRRNADDTEHGELDNLFKKTKASPHLYWLPLNEEQAISMAGKRVEREANKKAALAKRRRSPPPKRRSPIPIRRRSPSPRRRSPISSRRRPASPRRRSPSPRRRSPNLRRRLASPRRRSPISPRRRSRSISRDRGAVARRRSPMRRDRFDPDQRARSPLTRRSPISPRRRSPLTRRSPYSRRSPTRRRTPNDDSPPLRRRSPNRGGAPGRRSPMRGPPSRRSPMLRRSSPGGGRLSPVLLRRSSPGPIRRSPGPGSRRSPVLIRRSPRRSPLLARTQQPLLRGSPNYGQSSPRQRSPALRRRSPLRPTSPGRNYTMRF